MRRGRRLSAARADAATRAAAPKPNKRLQVLIDEGLADEVLRQLPSGKEADVFVVRCGGEIRAARIYKEATQRSFRQAVDYTENRKVKRSRQARAMAKGTRQGREQQEAAWQSAGTPLSGRCTPKANPVDLGALRREIEDVRLEAAARLSRFG